jgi:glycosyltransferase involved in cell wall biosynthesis
MKIVMVHNTYQQAGGEDIVFRNDCESLRSGGHEVVEYLRSNDDVEKFVSIRRLALAKQTIWASDTRREFRQLLQREKPHIVHIHNTFVMISPSIYWACRDARVPVVQTLQNYRLMCPGALFLRDEKVCEECMEHGVWRGVRYGCYRGSRPATAVVAAMLTTHRILGTWSRLIEYYLAPTEFGRRKYIAGGLPADKMLVKPNCVQPDPGEGKGDRSYALFVGRLSAEKGLRTLLAAWARLRESIPLQIVGDGLLRPELEEYARQQGLASVCFRGRLKGEETMAMMKGARCLVFPSECYEGLPMTVIEAFACGTPVIASNMGAMQDLIVDGRTGLHFTPGDAEDLANKAERAWTHAADMAVMGKQARQEYESKYTAASNYEILMGAYQQAIQNSGARHASLETGFTRPAEHYEN